MTRWTFLKLHEINASLYCTKGETSSLAIRDAKGNYLATRVWFEDISYLDDGEYIFRSNILMELQNDYRGSRCFKWAVRELKVFLIYKFIHRITIEDNLYI